MTGPSGAGKGTLIRALLERRDDLEVAISATTRPRRPGEVEGVHYHYLDDAAFDAAIAAGAFLEHVDFVAGHRYGTLEGEVDRVLASGASCVLELETKGAKRVKRERPDSVTIFVQAPTFAELERRLRERATESAGEIGERLDLARRQMAEAGDFDYVVTNDDVGRAADELEALVREEIGGTATLRRR